MVVSMPLVAVLMPVTNSPNRENAGLRLTLRLHPDSSCVAVTHIDAEVLLSQADNLTFAYVVTGTITGFERRQK